MNDPFTIIGAVLVIGVGLSLYFVPSIIASARNHPHQGTILAMNLLLGWTFFVWIALILWAIVERPSNKWVTIPFLHRSNPKKPGAGPQSVKDRYDKVEPWPTAEEETLTREQFMADERKGYMS